ncbi:MAG: tyrosine-type recombinase/integrase [Acidimicrobiales bacterium]
MRSLPSGRWQARYSDLTGERHTAPQTFARKTDAERFLTLTEADLARGEWIDPALGAVSFGEWAEEWRRTLVALRPSTRARDEGYLQAVVVPAFGARSIGDIDHLAVRQWVASLVADGRAPATVVKIVQILGQVLQLAADSGAIRSNPTRGVPRPRIESEEMRFLTPDEVATLAQAIDRRYEALVWLGAYGGLRAGELFALSGSRIDPLHRTVNVVESLVEVSGHHHLGPPKTKAGRRAVPVPSFVADRLAAHMAARAVQPNELVFPAPKGGPVRLSLWRRRFWYPAIEQAGVAPLRFHDLRHTAVAFWIAAGLTPLGIARRAGHSSVVVVQDRYGHLLPGAEAQADAALEQMARLAGSGTSPSWR